MCQKTINYDFNVVECQEPPEFHLQDKSGSIKKISIKVHILSEETWCSAVTSAREIKFKMHSTFSCQIKKINEFMRRKASRMLFSFSDSMGRRSALVCMLPSFVNYKPRKIYFHFLFAWRSSDCSKFFSKFNNLEFCFKSCWVSWKKCAL